MGAYIEFSHVIYSCNVNRKHLSAMFCQLQTIENKAVAAYTYEPKRRDKVIFAEDTSIWLQKASELLATAVDPEGTPGISSSTSVSILCPVTLSGLSEPPAYWHVFIVFKGCPHQNLRVLAKAGLISQKGINLFFPVLVSNMQFNAVTTICFCSISYSKCKHAGNRLIPNDERLSMLHSTYIIIGSPFCQHFTGYAKIVRGYIYANGNASISCDWKRCSYCIFMQADNWLPINF